MPLLSFQFIFQKLKKFLVLKNQKKFSGHPRINNLKFFDLEKLTRNSVKNDVGFHPKGVKKTIYTNVVCKRHKGSETKNHWESRNGFSKTAMKRLILLYILQVRNICINLHLLVICVSISYSYYDKVINNIINVITL